MQKTAIIGLAESDIFGRYNCQGSETHLLVLFAIVVYNGARHSVAERLSPVVLITAKKI
jgi:hypothetical protein